MKSCFDPIEAGLRERSRGIADESRVGVERSPEATIVAGAARSSGHRHGAAYGGD
jgi:hypothetical protein